MSRWVREIRTDETLGVTVRNDVGVVKRAVIVTKSQPLSKLGSRVLGFCMGIVEMSSKFRFYVSKVRERVLGHQHGEFS